MTLIVAGDDVAGQLQASDIYFSPRATVPATITFPLPLPGSRAYDRVRGWAGDLIVVQLAGNAGLTAKRKAALRTLGLRGRHSASLRDSRDVSTWGSVDVVRDLVAVIVLPDKIYSRQYYTKQDNNEIGVERFKYGSGTRPSELWRDERGAYFGYEYETGSLVTFWNTSLTLPDIVSGLPEIGMSIDNRNDTAYLAVEMDPNPPETQRPGVVSIIDSGPMSTSSHEGSWESLSGSLGLDRAVAAVMPMRGGFDVTWRRTYRRFYDQEFSWGSVGVLSSPPDILAVRTLFSWSGDLVLRSRVQCHVRVREPSGFKNYLMGQ